MRNQLFVVLGVSLTLSACFFSDDKNETPPTKNVDVSKPFTLMTAKKGTYTVNGNTATQISSYPRCDSGGILSVELDTTLWTFNTPSRLIKTHPGATWADTLTGGSSLENSEWLRIYANTDTALYLLKNSTVYEVEKNICPAQNYKKSLENGDQKIANVVVDTKTIYATGCGNISYTATANQKSFAVQISYAANQINGITQSFSWVMKIGDKTCTYTEQYPTPDSWNVNSCKETWNKYLADHPAPLSVPYTWHDKYSTPSNYLTFDRCIDSAFGLSNNQQGLPRKQLSRKIFK